GNGSVADQADTVSVGSSTLQRRITHVAPGIDPTDAINRAQLDSYRRETTARFNAQGDLISAVGAMSAALAMAAPDYRLRGAMQVNVGVGHYADAQAIGASFSGMLTERTSVRIGGSYAEGGESMVGAGLGFA